MELFCAGDFDEFGVLDGQIEPEMCPISAVRITLQNSSDFWVILSEVGTTNLCASAMTTLMWPYLFVDISRNVVTTYCINNEWSLTKCQYVIMQQRQSNAKIYRTLNGAKRTCGFYSFFHWYRKPILVLFILKKYTISIHWLKIWTEIILTLIFVGHFLVTFSALWQWIKWMWN